VGVHVDPLRDHAEAAVAAAARAHGTRWCHLIADTDDELHMFAARIGLRRAWAQQPGTAWSHYDLTPGKRAQAVAAGAVEIDHWAATNMVQRRLAPAVIGVFRGDHAFLSNFHDTPVVLDGDWWPTAEHAFQGAKTTDPQWRERIRAADGPSEAKRLGRRAPLVAGWDDLRHQTMRDVLSAKFSQHEPLAHRLLTTGDAHLEEGNTWGDTVWGTVDGVGWNLLGHLLMWVRDELAGPQEPAVAGSVDRHAGDRDILAAGQEHP
jgi:ribA/ribD-fused uncharacterized protein